jgi:hypothetical protein
MVITFVLACTTTSRAMPILMLKEGYTINEIAAILIAKVLGNFFAMMNFKKLFEKFGTFRLLTIGIVLIVQSMLLLFTFVNIKVFIPAFFLFGFAEQCSALIIKPIVGEFVSNYKKQFEMLLENFIRFLSAFLLILKRKYLALVAVSLATITLIPYALSEARNLFRKDYVQAYDSHLLFIYTHYNEYFLSSFLHNLSSFISGSYLVVFLTSLNVTKSAVFLSIYLSGQFLFSLPLGIFFNSLTPHKRAFAINFFIIFSASIAALAFSQDFGTSFHDINLFKGFSIALLGGSFSVSFKSYFRDIKHKEHSEVPIDMTEDQIKGIAALLGVIVGLTMLQIKNQIAIFVAIIIINATNILHLTIRKIIGKMQ